MRLVSRAVSRGRFLSLGLAFSFVLTVLVAASAAQEAEEQETSQESGSIAGTVASAAGAALGDAKVTITNKTTLQTSVARTDANGKYSSPALSPDDYAVHVEAKSFIAVTAPVTVKAGPATQLDFQLDPEPVAGVLPLKSVEALPVNGRSFLEYIQLEPGIQNQDGGTLDAARNGFSTVSVDSRLGRSARVDLDSLAITDETAGATLQNIPAVAVEEFRLGGLAAPVSAQLAQSNALNVVTRSGHNDLHGEFYGGYRNGSFASASLPGGHNDSWERQQYGGGVGGALIPDRLFFFISGERNLQDLRNTVLLGGPFAAISEAASSPARVNEPFREVSAAGRLDYQFSQKVRGFYRFAYDQNRDLRPFGAGPSLQPFLTRTNTPSHALGMDFNSEAFTHSFRFEYLKYRNDISDQSAEVSGLANPAPVTINIGGGARTACAPGSLFCSGPSPLAPQRNLQSNSQFRYDGTHPWRSHIFHFGGSYNRILAAAFTPYYALAPALSDQASVPLPAGILGSNGDPADPLNYPVQWAFLGNGQGFSSEKGELGLPGGGRRDNQTEVYAGDVWKARPSLTVSYGVHWLREDGKTDSDLAPIAQLNAWGPRLGDRVRQPNMNFAPQLGVAWEPGGSGKTVFRGGIGLYYDNALFQNLFFDRPLRLQQGAYLSTPAACVSGAAGAIQWPGNPGIPGSLIAGGAGIVNSNGTVSPTWCGESMGMAAPQAIALQQTYQAATATFSGPNPSFIGNSGSFAAPYANGLSLLAPNYQTPRSVQMELGMHHELTAGLILSFDYFRDVGTRNLLGIDVNHGGAAGTFNVNNAIAGRNAAQVANGCFAGTNQVSCMVAKLGPAGALAAYGAHGIGGPSQVTGGAPCPFCAFPGVDPNLGTNVMNFPVGRSTYSAYSIGLKQALRSFPSHSVQRAGFEASYTYSRYESQVSDSDLVNLASDFNSPTRFTGPNGLDRTHQYSLGMYFELPHALRLSALSHFGSPLPVTLRFQQSSGGAEVLVTDWTGDGTVGDIVPGSNVGSYMRSIGTGDLGTFLGNYDTNVAGGSNPTTPAGSMLVNAGIFSLAELEQMGGVMQSLAAVTQKPAALGWLKTFDLRLGWEHRFFDRVSFEPNVAVFNLFNFANFDLPGNTQNGILNFGAGSLSPWATAVQPQSTVGGTTSNLSLPSGRINRASLQSGMNAQGAPRAIEWGVKISF
ncbi:MAG TPA: carboxypeptidase-like regulatory domain-containing protein [Terriglobales bacterium]|nr:carboxypeptidase-like regulatory domain-containing protein [Terriglobales bacterium]